MEFWLPKVILSERYGEVTFKLIFYELGLKRFWPDPLRSFDMTLCLFVLWICPALPADICLSIGDA